MARKNNRASDYEVMSRKARNAIRWTTEKFGPTDVRDEMDALILEVIR